MDAPEDSPPDKSDIQCITVTVRCGGSNVIDSLIMPGCDHWWRSQLFVLSTESKAHTQEVKHLWNMTTNSFKVPKLAESQGTISLADTDSKADPEENDDGTCASLTLNVAMDPMLASCLTMELRRSRSFASSFRCYLLTRIHSRAAADNGGFQIQRRKEQDYGLASDDECCVCRHLYLGLWLSRTRKYFQMEPDIRWSDRMLPQWIRRVQMEEAFSWLSTLGGAYSSLGDNMYNCALEAGRVALRQLYLAECLGDAMLRSRCLLYIALSLMQRGKLAKAKSLVRQQYKFATAKTEYVDTRLVCMCQGIWHHLRHHYAKRKET
ncbi:uncharacterized protein LOC110976579 [Acanthaster planci]|uniref:Uncharacterized protein LOC110976579 n=1 Tax=Acanthaster planci TaxID=133434 RepID=A0A8B7XZH4_ACAPL|nr:uncharacterized protein LOC110976579 [Acanthaster planci]XP_022085661.1 uncharacterized protein LOC110976579 [Acanthaster planci]XP_022085662.1 uncharacterized protein LOC110976579 [Acanthaster planci]XP_022085663.1 uncharacterized protein LOC110976579 [Acanthaster planci]